jgi:hypothetical protein
MAIVVRLGPLPLGRRRASRVAELERILATAVEVIEVIDVTRLTSAIAVRKVAAVALDAPGPEDLADAITAAGSRPVLRPLWKQERNSRGEVDDVFDGYGLLTADGVERLADGQLRAP